MPTWTAWQPDAVDRTMGFGVPSFFNCREYTFSTTLEGYMSPVPSQHVQPSYRETRVSPILRVWKSTDTSAYPKQNS